MKTSEADEIIAGFMNRKVSYGMLLGGRLGTSINPSANYLEDIYSKSLDALVPVWEKLDIDPEFIKSKPDGGGLWNCLIRQITIMPDFEWESSADTIQDAAAIATAKAILVLK